MFFGGYHWPLPATWAPIFGPVNILIKIVLFLSGMVWVRATMPRIRYDRLMAFGWKVMFPLALLSLAWTAVVLVVADTTEDPLVYQIVAGLLMGAVALLLLFWAWRHSRRSAPRPDITDSRNSLGWAVIHAIGAVVAAPFAAYDWLMAQRGGFSGLWDATRQEETARRAGRANGAAVELEAPPVEPDGAG
jgi:hypothetical protein